MWITRANVFLTLSVVLVATFTVTSTSHDPLLSSARVVFQTNYGDIEFGFYPSVAPLTVEHIFKLVRLGCYNTNHFFRVDKGFVAQVADVAGGRSAPMNEEQRIEAEKTVIGEFSDVKHVRGILSMGRYEDPNSASSSFSILLGDAPHLDGKYAIFGKVTKGDDTLKKLEQLPTRQEGIFVMPTERITILSSYYYDHEMESCEENRSILKRQLAASAVEIERQDEMFPMIYELKELDWQRTNDFTAKNKVKHSAASVSYGDIFILILSVKAWTSWWANLEDEKGNTKQITRD